MLYALAVSRRGEGAKAPCPVLLVARGGPSRKKKNIRFFDFKQKKETRKGINMFQLAIKIFNVRGKYLNIRCFWFLCSFPEM